MQHHTQPLSGTERSGDASATTLNPSCPLSSRHFVYHPETSRYIPSGRSSGFFAWPFVQSHSMVIPTDGGEGKILCFPPTHDTLSALVASFPNVCARTVAGTFGIVSDFVVVDDAGCYEVLNAHHIDRLQALKPYQSCLKAHRLTPVGRHCLFSSPRPIVGQGGCGVYNAAALRQEAFLLRNYSLRMWCDHTDSHDASLRVLEMWLDKEASRAEVVPVLCLKVEGEEAVRKVTWRNVMFDTEGLRVTTTHYLPLSPRGSRVVEEEEELFTIRATMWRR